MNKYISADCGTGKTHMMVKEICMTYQNVKHLIVQPTTLLNSKTAERLQAISEVVRVVNQKTAEGFVLKNVKHIMNEDSVRVVLITEPTFYSLTVAQLSGFKIWMDDCVNFHNKTFISITADDYDNLSKLYKNSVFDYVKTYCEGYDEVTIKPLLEGNSTDTNNIISNLNNIAAGYNRMAVNQDYYDNAPEAGQKRFIKFVAWHDLSVYKDLDIVWMANNFESTLIYKHNRAVMEKMDFKGLAGIDKNRLDVRYFVKSENLKYGLTKSYAESIEGKDALQKVRNYINTNEDSFYFTTNIDGDKVASLNGDSYSPNLRGVDDMNTMKTCAWLSCMNPDANESRMMSDVFGFTSLDLKIEREYEVLYQFACRGVIRVRDSEEVMVVYVVTEDQALFLTDNPTFIDVGVETKEVDKGGRPQGKTLSEEETKKWNAFKKKCARNNNYTGFEEFVSTLPEHVEFLTQQWNKLLAKKVK